MESRWRPSWNECFAVSPIGKASMIWHTRRLRFGNYGRSSSGGGRIAVNAFLLRRLKNLGAGNHCRDEFNYDFDYILDGTVSVVFRGITGGDNQKSAVQDMHERKAMF